MGTKQKNKSKTSVKRGEGFVAQKIAPVKKVFSFFTEKESIHADHRKRLRLLARFLSKITSRQEGTSFKSTDTIFPIEDLWKVESVLGSDYVKENISDVIYVRDIEKIFKKSNKNIYISTDRNKLFAVNYDMFESKFGPLTEMKIFKAYKTYGLDLLEQLFEKGELKINGKAY